MINWKVMKQFFSSKFFFLLKIQFLQNFLIYLVLQISLKKQANKLKIEHIHFLWNHKNETVSRDKLLDSIWGEHVYTTSRTIDNFIMKLRNKIEFDPNKPQLIISIHGVGYKLIIKQGISQISFIQILQQLFFYAVLVSKFIP